MRITLSKQNSKTDILIIPIKEGENLSNQQKKQISKQHILEVESLIENKIFKGKTGESFVFQNIKSSKKSYKSAIIIGLGDKKKINVHSIKKSIASITNHQKKLKADKIAILHENPKEALWLATGIFMNTYKFDKYITKKIKKISEVQIINAEISKEEITKMNTLLESIYYTRDLVNSTSNDIDPDTLVEEAKKIAKENPLIKLTILDRKKLESLGCGAILSIGQSSTKGPYMVIMEYKNEPKKDEKPLAIIGKGITFDTGGLYLKPAMHMNDMKMDKAGACTVLGLFKTFKNLKPKGHILGVLAIAENLIGKAAIRPGDIIKAYDGKTIEILNTDGEGRIVLADAIAYTKKNYNPSKMISIATLTGAAIVTLGYDIGVVLSTDEELAKQIIESGKEVDEPFWELPLYEDYCENVKGKISDITNSGYTVKAQTIMGAAFLKAFAGKTPLAHLDIAGTAWSNENKPGYPAGATAFGIMMFQKLLEKMVVRS
ncbi:MAG: leucyl aminopeptidase family protein [Candidatus Gracilibacteria bacterium]